MHSSMDNLDDVVYDHRFFASKSFNGGRNGDGDGDGNALTPPSIPYFLNHNCRNDLNDAAYAADERFTVKTRPDVIKQIVASVAKLKRKMPRMVFNYLNRRSDKSKGITARSKLRPAGSGRKIFKEQFSSMFHHFFNDSKKPKMGSMLERKEDTANGHGEEGINPTAEVFQEEIFNGYELDDDDPSDRFEELSLSDVVIKDESAVEEEQVALKPVKKSKISPFHLLKMKLPTKKKDGGSDDSSNSGGSKSRYGGIREGLQKKTLQTRSFQPEGIGSGGGHETKALKAKSWKKEKGLFEKPIMMGRRCQLLDLNSSSLKYCGEDRKPFFIWEGEGGRGTINH